MMVLLARTGSEHPFIGPEPACGIPIRVAKKAVRDWTNRNHTKQSESKIGLKQAKGLRQNNEGSVGIKQRPIKMDGRTTYWTLPPKRTPFQIGIDR
jgi:hypothetical protein